jgi:hypothetical protein
MTITIRGPVGQCTGNDRMDVWNVQVLLVKVRTAKGEPPIGIDGRVGPETIGAIKSFQKQQFGWANPDGRVDPQGNTLKHLNLLTDQSGNERHLLEPVTTFKQGRWEVKVGADGEIIVKPGDWLSKYSAAVNGNFYTIEPYMRRTDDGQFIRIRDPNLITAGESLYHIPTLVKLIEKSNMPAVELPTPTPLSDSEKKKLSEQFIASEFNLQGDNVKVLADGLQVLEVGDAALTVAEVAGLVAEGTVLAGLATAAALGAAFGGIVAGVISFINVSQTGEKMTGMRAVAYASVAWAFEDDKMDRQFPGISRKLMINISAGGVTPAEISRNKRAWADAVIETKKRLELTSLGRLRNAGAKTQKLLIASGKRRLTLAGNDNRQQLCRFIMKSFEGQLSGSQLVAWKNTCADFVYNE